MKKINQKLKSKSTEISKPKKRFSRKFTLMVVLGVTVLVCACLYAVVIYKSPSRATASIELKPRTLEELLALSEEDLGKVDIARMNLLCITEVPTMKNLDMEKYVSTIDQWAEVVKAAEKKYLPAYYRNPAKYENSLAKFKAIYLVLSIQEDLKCGYNMELIRSGAMRDIRSLRFFKDSRDLFLHGLVDRQKGSCASLPVLVVALGRKCGYPLYLVTTKGHLFVRWDDGNEIFNIEVSTTGTDIYPDEHYHNWPFPTSEEERKREKYLQNHTPHGEFGLFMHTRASYLQSNEHFSPARWSCMQALRVFPESVYLQRHYSELQHLANLQVSREMLMRVNEKK